MSDQDSVIQELIEKTNKELEEAKKPQSFTRVWKDPKGYEYLGVWQNAALLRILVRKFTLISNPYHRLSRL